MIWIIAAVVIVAIVLFLLTKRSENRKPGQTALPYQKAEALFSPAERSFLGVLHKAVSNNAAIFGKVRAADVVEPKTGLNIRARQDAFNKISDKRFDFLLCNKENLSVACAIELDYGSYNSKRRDERDEFVKKVCEAAGVPLIRVPAKPVYVIDEVRRLIAPYLCAKETPYKEQLQTPTPQKPENNTKVCPNCSAFMVKHIAKNGKHAGKQFWACSAFPECKTIEVIQV
jgi:hypothetical protein